MGHRQAPDPLGHLQAPDWFKAQILRIRLEKLMHDTLERAKLLATS